MEENKVNSIQSDCCELSRIHCENSTKWHRDNAKDREIKVKEWMKQLEEDNLRLRMDRMK